MTLVRSVLSRGKQLPLFHYVDLDNAFRTRGANLIALCGALAVNEAMDPRTPHRLCARCKRASQGGF